MATPPSTSVDRAAPAFPGAPRRRRSARPHQRRRRTRRILASEGVFDSIVSLAGDAGSARHGTRPARRSAGSTTSWPGGPTGRRIRP